jgi:NarL family two-component system response regulator LiaR
LRKSPIRIVLADDNEVVRASLKLFMEANADLQLVEEAVDGYEAISACVYLKPDLVLMDINMPNMDGIEATRIIRQRCPNMYILALSSFSDNNKVQKILNVGANKYIPKQTSIDDLARNIRNAVNRNGFNPSLRWVK